VVTTPIRHSESGFVSSANGDAALVAHRYGTSYP